MSPLCLRNQALWRVTKAASSSMRAVAPVTDRWNDRRFVATTTAESSSLTVQRSLSSLHPYWVLSKGKLTVWVALSALPGYIVAAPVFSPMELSMLIAGTAACSASSQSMNQFVEQVHDRKMKRTQQRPLITGALREQDALAFCAGSGLIGLSTLGALNPMTAAIGAATWGSYIYVYTPMKRVSPYNTHVGAVVGSLPTLLGFSAVCGGSAILSSPWLPHAIFVFALQTLWQMPHFYSLAWLCRRDYSLAGYKMFCIDDPTGAETARNCLPYMAVIATLPVAATAFSLTSSMFLVDGMVVNAVWLHTFRAFYRAPDKNTCRRFFLVSMGHLLATLGLFSLHARTRDGEHPAWRKSIQDRVMQSICVHEKFKDDPVFCPTTDGLSTDEKKPKR